MISMENPKTKKIVYILSIIFVVFSYFFVRHSLDSEDIKVIDTSNQEEDDVPEVSPAIAHLLVTDGVHNWNYRARMKNTNSVADFMEELRDAEGFSYELTAYTYGTDISKVNGITATEDKKWILRHFTSLDWR